MSSVNWLCDEEAKASAHLVVARGGGIWQLARFNIKTWHAGKSVYRGIPGVNNFSIGIEIVNPGKLEPSPKGAKAWFGNVYDTDEYKIEHAETPYHGSGLWMPYTESQIEQVSRVCTELFRTYPTLVDITTHWEISPGRKVDTNPLFPLEYVRSKAQGRFTDDGAYNGPVLTVGKNVNLR